jgi:hypothetical protein
MSTRGRWVALAAAVAVLLGAGWFVFVRTVRDGGPVGITAAGPMSVWPESPLDPEDALRVEQARVDGGKDDWRLDAEEVVARFAQQVFGWVSIRIDPPAGTANGPATYRMRSDCEACGDSTDEWVGVTVDRLLADRQGGVWSVIAVTSPHLRLPVKAGDTVVAGQSLPFGLDLAQDRHAAVGLRYVERVGSTSCGDGLAGEAGITATDVSVTVPDPLFTNESCTAAAGYVFAYTSPKLTVQTGDPLLEPAYIADLSIVPVRFSQEPVAPTPD